SLLHEPVGFSRALANIANVHYSLGNTEKALEYIGQCHALALKNNYRQGLAYASKLRGRIYRKMAKLPEALKAYEEALSAYEKMGDIPNRSEVFNSMGNIYYDLKDFVHAQQYYKQSNVYAKRNQSRSLVAYNYSSLGFTYYEQKKWKQAIAYLDSSRILAAQLGYPYLVMDAYEVLGKIEGEQKNFQKALLYMNKYMTLKDSLTAAENRTAIAEVDARYQHDKQAAEISLLQKDNQLQAAALRQNRIIQAAIVLVALAIVAIAFLLVNRYRIIHRTRRQIELERVRHQIATDLHDDIGATLSSINIVSSLALQSPGDQATNTQHLQRIRDHSERILENMSDIIWSINPANDSMDQVIFRMKDFCAEILDPKNIACTFHHLELLFSLDIDINARKNLFLIFKEAINNVAKYSEATAVDIIMEGSSQHWVIRIIDNGVGFNSGSVTAGNGLANMQKRAEAMGAQFSLTTAPGKGTTVVITK
ncbi:MAG TPA: sensor histidine kinase, partial [Ohtaekwangia sp.]